MVCKEDVLLWFKDLESYKRIDVLYDLLNMCLPFELRFIGSCIEEFGKHTYQELRGPAITANDIDKLAKDCLATQGLLDETVRHRVLIYLSLLSSRNYSVANWLYKNVLRTDSVEDLVKISAAPGDESVHSEFLLLFVMALHHPAFNFEQKLNIYKVLSQLMDLKETQNRISPKPTVYGYPPGFGYPPPKSNLAEIPVVPVKTSMTIPCADETLHQQPPGFPHVPPLPTPQEFMTTWSRPGIPCGAPVELNFEMQVPHPFPPATNSPLVSEAASPIQSRSSSPHKPIVTLRSTPMPPPLPLPPAIDIIPTQPLVDPLSPNFTFVYQPENVKIPDEDNLNSIPEERMPEVPWPPGQQVLLKDMKPANGLRFSAYPKVPRNLALERHFQALNLEGDPECLQRSNSSSSSSLNQSPPDTPLAAPASCHVRGEKGRCNGMQQTFVVPPGMPLCDTTSPPPPPTFNSTVPYTSFPTTFAAALPPRRATIPTTRATRLFPSPLSIPVTCPLFGMPILAASTAEPPDTRAPTALDRTSTISLSKRRTR